MLACLVLNSLLVFSNRSQFADYIADVSHTTGIRMGADFDERVRNLPLDEYAAWLRLQTEDKTDVFDGYTTGYIAESYISTHDLTGIIADLMRDKYERLQAVVDENAESGAGMSLYYADATYDRHTHLFRMMMVALLFEGIILTALVMLLSLGYENSAKTEFVVYSTKKGRKINSAKLISCIIIGLAAYALITVVTLTLFFTINPLGGTGGSNVSSGFNYIWDLITGGRPFVTWHSFTVITYLLAIIGVSAGLILCFAILAYITGLWIRNSYIGFLVLAVMNFAVFALPFVVFGLTLPTFFLIHSPIWLAMQQGVWFTDGGSNALFPHFETIGIIASFVVAAAFALWSSKKFKRRNLL